LSWLLDVKRSFFRKSILKARGRRYYFLLCYQ